MACESTPHYNRTQVALVGRPLPPKPHDTVTFFANKTDVPGPYDVIALFSVEGQAGEEAAFLKAFLYHAADLGADAVIFERVSLVAGSEGGGWFVGRGGGFGSPSKVTQDAVYRGEAIHFK